MDTLANQRACPRLGSGLSLDLGNRGLEMKQQEINHKNQNRHIVIALFLHQRNQINSCLLVIQRPVKPILSGSIFRPRLGHYH